MEYKGCPHEKEIAQATRTGDWKPDLTLHRQQCLICLEVTQVAGSVQTLLTFPESTRPLPDPDLIWFRAQLMKMQSAEARILRPFIVADISASVISMATAALLFTWHWPKIQQFLVRLLV